MASFAQNTPILIATINRDPIIYIKPLNHFVIINHDPIFCKLLPRLVVLLGSGIPFYGHGHRCPSRPMMVTWIFRGTFLPLLFLPPPAPSSPPPLPAVESEMILGFALLIEMVQISEHNAGEARNGAAATCPTVSFPSPASSFFEELFHRLLM